MDLMKFAPLIPFVACAPLASPTLALGGAGGNQVFNPANGHYYEVVHTNVSWEEAKLAAESVSYLGVQGHLVTITDELEDSFVYFQINNGNPLGFTWFGLYQDLNDVNYSEPLGGWKWVTGEPVVYSNWFTAQPNNGGGNEHYGYYWPAFDWADTRLDSSAPTAYVIEYDTADAVPFCNGLTGGTGCPCGNVGSSSTGCGNSVGSGAKLLAMGTSELSNGDLGFIGEGLVPGQASILFQGENALGGGDGLLFGDGLRCAGFNVKRLGVRVPDASGSATWTALTSGTNIWSPGDVRHFQLWYADAAGTPCGGGFNTSNALEVSFYP